MEITADLRELEQQKVKNWLESVYLTGYTTKFLQNGYDNMLAISNLDQTDLDTIGISLPGHRKTLMVASQRLREDDRKTTQSPALPHHVTSNLAAKSNGSLQEAERLANLQLKEVQLELERRSKPNRPRELVSSDDYKPKFRILLVRHGLSMANVDKNLYKTMADHAIPLSETGQAQAFQAGESIKHYFQELYKSDKPPDGFHCRLWTSCYKRARETAENIGKSAGPWVTSTRESIYLGEQQFGLFEGTDWTSGELDEQHQKEIDYYRKASRFGGRFWAKVPLGESRFDVCMRVCRAFGTFHRDAARHSVTHLIIVSHGITIRAFTMMWMHYNPEWFEKEPNPSNCSIRLLEGAEDKGYIHLGPEMPKDLLLSLNGKDVAV